MEEMQKYMESVFPEADEREYFEQIISHAAVGGRKFNKVIIAYGEGGNGKTFFSKVMKEGLGDKCYLTTGSEFIFADARDKNMLIVDESENLQLSEAFLRNLLDNGALVNILIRKRLPYMTNGALDIFMPMPFRATFGERE